MKGKISYLLFSFIILLLISFNLFDRTNITTFNFLHIIKDAQEIFSDDLVIIGLDVKSSQKLNQPVLPPRKVIAKAIDNLTKLGAKVIALDIMFNGKKDEESDQILIKSLKKSGRVVLAGEYSTYTDGINIETYNEGEFEITKSISSTTQIGYLSLNKKILNSAKAVGAINMKTDDILNSYNPVMCDKNNEPYFEKNDTSNQKKYITKFGLKIMEIFKNSDIVFDPPNNQYLIGNIKIPMNYRNEMNFNYQATDQLSQPKYYSFYTLIDEEAFEKYHEEDFKDKIVLIFPAALAHRDMVPCPLIGDSENSTMYGGMIHANVVNQILKSKYLYKFSPRTVQFSLLLFMMIFIILFYRLPLWLGIILYILTSFSYPAVSMILFYYSKIIGLNIILFEILLLVSFFLSLGMKYLRARQIKSIFSRFVGDNIMKEVLKIRNEKNLLSGKRQELSILLLDIRGFTKLSDEIPSEDVVKILNSFFDVASDIILFNGGTIDKYMGDAIMAFFGAPIGIDDKEKKAVDCLAEIIEITKNMKFQGYSLKIGGAITTGEVIVGNIGCSKKLEYTIIGPAVNLAARLESLNKKYKTSILIDLNTAEKCERKDEIISIAKEEIRGFSEKIELFTLKPKSEE